jgi:hypothetical protein
MIEENHPQPDAAEKIEPEITLNDMQERSFILTGHHALPIRLAKIAIRITSGERAKRAELEVSRIAVLTNSPVRTTPQLILAGILPSMSDSGKLRRQTAGGPMRRPPPRNCFVRGHRGHFRMRHSRPFVEGAIKKAAIDRRTIFSYCALTPPVPATARWLISPSSSPWRRRPRD